MKRLARAGKWIAAVMLVVFFVSSYAAANRTAETDTKAVSPTAAQELNTPEPVSQQQTPPAQSSSQPASSVTAVAPQLAPIKPYTAPKCTKTSVPYTTEYRLSGTLGVGKTNVIGGADGYTISCTPDSNGYKKPDDTVPVNNKTVFVGDGGASLSRPMAPNEPYDIVYTRVTGTGSCGDILNTINDLTAYNLCVTSVMKYFGY